VQHTLSMKTKGSTKNDAFSSIIYVRLVKKVDSKVMCAKQI